MGLALDEPKANDQRIEESGISFLVASGEEPYVLGGATLHVDYHADAYSRRFYVRRGGRAAGCF